MRTRPAAAGGDRGGSDVGGGAFQSCAASYDGLSNEAVNTSLSGVTKGPQECPSLRIAGETNDFVERAEFEVSGEKAVQTDDPEEGSNEAALL